MFIWKRPYGLTGEGLNFLLWAALSAFTRILLEPFWGDSVVTSMGSRSAQVIGLIILAGSLGLLDRWMRSGQRKQEYGGPGTGDDVSDPLHAPASSQGNAAEKGLW
jgi:hypothetical protein